MVARHAGRSGRPWRRIRKQVLANSDLCAWCGHPGAKEVDHKTGLYRGGNPTQRANLQPMHGSSGPCPTCGLSCNQVKYWAEYRAQHPTPRNRTPKPLTW